MDDSEPAGFRGGGHAEESESLRQTDSTSNIEGRCRGVFCLLKGCQRTLEHNAFSFPAGNLPELLDVLLGFEMSCSGML